MNPKKLLLFCFLYIGLILKSSCQEVLSMREMSNIFNIKVENITGTCFVVFQDGVNYLVTAKHLFKKPFNWQIQDYEIFHENEWKKFRGKLLIHSNPRVDIALIQGLSDAIVNPHVINLSSANLFIGDEGFFVGFPLNLKMDDASKINNGYPFPLVKRASISASIHDAKVSILLLDGHNNKGFSGGPYFNKNRQNSTDNNWYITGVISGYVTDLDNSNSGLIIVHGAEHIREIISQNK